MVTAVRGRNVVSVVGSHRHAVFSLSWPPRTQKRGLFSRALPRLEPVMPNGGCERAPTSYSRQLQALPQPKVNENACTPGSRYSIWNTRSTIGFGWRMSW